MNLEQLLLMTDLDGTLLPSSKILNPLDVEAIARFREAGGRFSFATGRTYQAAQRYIEALRLDTPLVLCNGAEIYDPEAKTVLDTVTLPPQSVGAVQKLMNAFPDVAVEILRTWDTLVARMTPYEEWHLGICQVEPILGTLEELPHDGWLKVLFAMAVERVPDVAAFFRSEEYAFVDFVQTEPHLYEMVSKGVTKGSALQKIRARPGMDGFTYIAAGDFDNDLELLAAADKSACPASAQACVKAAADWILDRTNEEGAIAELVARLMRD